MSEISQTVRSTSYTYTVNVQILDHPEKLNLHFSHSKRKMQELKNLILKAVFLVILSELISICIYIVTQSVPQ